MAEHAVFFDPSRKRWSWIKRISGILGLASVVVVTLFLLSIATTPLLPGMPGITSEIRRSLRHSVNFSRHQTQLQNFILRRDRTRLLDALARDRAARRARAALPPIRSSEIVAAFYAPWQETGLHSFRANAARMTHLLPAWVHLTADGTALDFRDWDPAMVPHNLDVLDIARTNNLNVVPVLSNALQSEFDTKRVHLFLTNVAIQDRAILQLRGWLLQNRFQGINVDFENLDPADYPLMIPFLRRLQAAFAPSRLSVSVDLEAETYKELDWKAVSSVSDFVIVMAYDEHSSVGPAGPIASMRWYRDIVNRAARTIPREKLVVGLANYAYDWAEGNDWADPTTYQGALVTAKRYRPDEPPEKLIDFDPDALNPTYWYIDDAGKEHEVWMLDAVTAANQWMVAQNYGIRGAALWVLGSSDPSVWTFLRRGHLSEAPNPSVLRTVSFPYDVEFVGEGEVLHVSALPTSGERSLEVDPGTGLLIDESYHRFPTSFVIDRSGYKPKTIALTIDDGPASPFTAQILDVLKQDNVKATFFLIGENAERYPNLVRRIWREGHEIGNHSYTHPNMGAIPESRARFELNATQRVFQSILHRSTLLFRPPYNADAEPTSAEEVTPVVLASSMNYISVGEFIDPQDWNTEQLLPNHSMRKRTAPEMLATVLQQLDTEKGSCVLLHDGGGDRRESVKLLQMLIPELRKRGYQFETVSGLIGATRDQVNPPVMGADSFMLASDRIVFEALYLFELFLTIAFISGIVLGTLRVVFVTTLAIVERRREKRATFAAGFRPRVSVVIAAYNEAKVIARTIEAVLANDYPDLEIVVVDDGSQDGTADVVEKQFGSHPAVRVLRQENGGKASALNNGMANAAGEIIVALDADTLFARDTIAKLVRRFADPLVGAVAGNVKVGNRINPLTYWQSIEYITSQNLDRRAYSVMNSVTVVPGAVGAWRREAVLQADGYTTDTMAEDMDLTWRIRRIGWRVATETEAIGYTEAPDTFRGLFKQRFRWAFGTLQCLWKHRTALGRYGWFGKLMLPSLWLFQIAYQTISPLVDLQIAWSVGSAIHAWARGRLTQDWQPLPNALESLYVVAFMYAFFFVIELVGSYVAFRLDREDKSLLVWLFWQRFLYRQLMYAVLLRSIKTAISGMRTGWGKLERKGTVELAAEAR